MLKPSSDVQEVDVGPGDVLFKLLTQDLVIKNGFPFYNFNIMTISWVKNALTMWAQGSLQCSLLHTAFKFFFNCQHIVSA